jgi:hypothetical protein
MAASVEWARRVSKWRASGETAGVFAARHGWNPRTLTWWASTLKRRDASTAGTKSRAVEFARVVAKEPVPRASSSSGTIEILLSHGRCVRVLPGFTPDLLRAVLETLERS